MPKEERMSKLSTGDGEESDPITQPSDTIEAQSPVITPDITTHITPDITNSDIDVHSSNIWVCPICHTDTTKTGKPFGSWGSLRAHISRSHGVYMSKEEYQAGTTKESLPVTPPQKKKKPTLRGMDWSSRSEEADEDEDDEDDYDIYDDFKEVCSTFSAGKKKLGKIMSLMGDYDLDNYWHLQRALKKSGMRYNDIAGILEKWRNKCGKPIPKNIAEEYGIPDEDGGDPWEYNRGRGRGRDSRRGDGEEDIIEKEIQKTLRQIRQVTVLNKLSKNDDDDDYSESDEVRDLRDEVKDKEREIESLKMKIEFRDMIKSEVEPLKEELRQERETRRDLERKSKRKPADKLIDKIAEQVGDSVLVDGTTVKDFKDILSSAKTYVIKGPKGVEPLENKPKLERGGPSTVAGMVAEQAPHLVIDFNEPATQSRGIQMERKRYSGSVVGDDVGVKE